MNNEKKKKRFGKLRTKAKMGEKKGAKSKQVNQKSQMDHLQSEK